MCDIFDFAPGVSSGEGGTEGEIGGSGCAGVGGIIRLLPTPSEFFSVLSW